MIFSLAFSIWLFLLSGRTGKMVTFTWMRACTVLFIPVHLTNTTWMNGHLTSQRNVKEKNHKWLGTLYWCVEEETNFFLSKATHIHRIFFSICQSFTFAVPHYHYHHSKRQYKYIENHRLLMPRNFVWSETRFGFHCSLEVRPSSKSKRGSRLVILICVFIFYVFFFLPLSFF